MCLFIGYTYNKSALEYCEFLREDTIDTVCWSNGKTYSNECITRRDVCKTGEVIVRGYIGPFKNGEFEIARYRILIIFFTCSCFNLPQSFLIPTYFLAFFRRTIHAKNIETIFLHKNYKIAETHLKLYQTSMKPCQKQKTPSSIFDRVPNMLVNKVFLNSNVIEQNATWPTMTHYEPLWATMAQYALLWAIIICQHFPPDTWA